MTTDEAAAGLLIELGRAKQQGVVLHLGDNNNNNKIVIVIKKHHGRLGFHQVLKMSG